MLDTCGEIFLWGWGEGEIIFPWEPGGDVW